MWFNNTGGSKIEGGGQIEVFIILNGHENINPNIYIYFLNKTRKRTRGHDFTLVVVRLEQR